MSFGIYKQGQGYWVRVLTAAMIAVITLGAAGWMAGQTARFEAQLPRSTFAYTLGTPNGTIAVGDSVSLIGKPEARGSAAKELGTAKVAAYDAANMELRINEISIPSADADASAAATVRATGFDAPVRAARGVSPIEPRLLIGIVVGVVLVLGSGLAYYFAGVRRGAVDFLISTDMEMKKVHWSTAREIRSSTLVVIGACVIIAMFLYGVDNLFSWIFRSIGILVGTG